MSADHHELARDAERSRARLDLAIDRLENRLTPIGLVDEAVGFARRSASAPLVDEGMRLLRRNPLPIFLIAAGAGILAWQVRQQRAAPDLPGKAGAAGADAPAAHAINDQLEGERK